MSKMTNEGSAPWPGCGEKVCRMNGACWDAGKCLNPENYTSADDLDAEIHRLLALKIERFPEYAKSLLEGYATKVEVFDHMIKVAQAAGFASLTEAISVAKKARAASPQPVAQTERALTLDEYHEDYGNVVWWAWEDGEWLGEPAWIGTPSCSDWPGYHTHWTRHPERPLAALPASGAAHD